MTENKESRTFTIRAIGDLALQMKSPESAFVAKSRMGLWLLLLKGLQLTRMFTSSRSGSQIRIFSPAAALPHFPVSPSELLGRTELKAHATPEYLFLGSSFAPLNQLPEQQTNWIRPIERLP